VSDNEGAYGFRLEYPSWAEGVPDLVDVGSDAPTITFRWRDACTAVTHDHANHETAALGARGGSSFYADRNAASVTFDIPGRPDPDALIHPLGTAPLAVFARWRGDVTLHAGGFASNRGAWMVGGRREAGKSTTLAALATRGYPIIADDLFAVQDRMVWCGPRCIDLRPDAAERFPEARDLGGVGTRPRFRLLSAAAPPTLPLRGLFLLEWHERPMVDVLPMHAAARLAWLHSLDYIGLMGPLPPLQILDLAALPAWIVRRPRDWRATDDAIDIMLRLTETA
jgi:hypothetical protein